MRQVLLNQMKQTYLIFLLAAVVSVVVAVFVHVSIVVSVSVYLLRAPASHTHTQHIHDRQKPVLRCGRDVFAFGLFQLVEAPTWLHLYVCQLQIHDLLIHTAEHTHIFILTHTLALTHTR